MQRDEATVPLLAGFRTDERDAVRRRRARGTARKGGRWVGALVVPMALLAVWQWAITSGAVPDTLIAAPADVAERFAALLADGTLLENGWASVQRLALGFFIGVGVGGLVGAAVGISSAWSRLAEPTVLALIPIPAVAWIPLLIIVLGIGNTSKVILIAIGGFCTLFISTAAAVRAVDHDLVEVAAVLEKSRWQLIRRVLLPAAIPEMLSAARVALALSWTLLVAAEVVAADSGLGWFIWDARNFVRPDDMIAGMVTIGLLGKLTDSVLVRYTRRRTSWRRSYGESTA